MARLAFQRFFQATDSTCGPTVIRMLLDFYKIKVTEEQVLEATSAQNSIESNGTRIDQLALSVKKLAPRYNLLYKEDASIKEIARLIYKYHVPVAVNWQGLFWKTLLEEAKLSTNIYHGHYSIATEVNFDNDTISIADPYKEFEVGDRFFPIDWFKSRWWDISDTFGTEIKEDISYYNSRLIFIVYPKNKTLPQSFEMKTVESDYFQKKIDKARLTQSIHPLFEPNPKKTALMSFLSSFNRNILKRL